MPWSYQLRCQYEITQAGGTRVLLLFDPRRLQLHISHYTLYIRQWPSLDIIYSHVEDKITLVTLAANDDLPQVDHVDIAVSALINIQKT